MARIPFRPPLPPWIELAVAVLSLAAAIVEYKRRTSEQKPPPPWQRPPGA
jgi:hypothetical protein